MAAQKYCRSPRESVHNHEGVDLAIKDDPFPLTASEASFQQVTRLEGAGGESVTRQEGGGGGVSVASDM